MMVLQKILHQYKRLLFPTFLSWIQCISLPKVSILITLVFILISSKFHGLNYGIFKSLGRINIVITLVLILLPPKVHGLNYEDFISRGRLSMLLHILTSCRF